MKDFKAIWADLAHRKKICPRNIVEYAVLRAMVCRNENKTAIAKILIGKAFSPTFRESKLNNGHAKWRGLADALKAAQSKFYLEKGFILGTKIEKVFDSDEEYFAYKKLLASLSVESITAFYVYVFVRQDISPEYQLVQAAHCTMVLGSKLGPSAKADETYFSVIGVKDLSALRAVESFLKKSNVNYVHFDEPDISEDKRLQLTSLATYPIMCRKRGRFLNYKKLVFKPNCPCAET